MGNNPRSSSGHSAGGTLLRKSSILGRLPASQASSNWLQMRSACSSRAKEERDGLSVDPGPVTVLASFIADLPSPLFPDQPQAAFDRSQSATDFSRNLLIRIAF